MTETSEIQEKTELTETEAADEGSEKRRTAFRKAFKAAFPKTIPVLTGYLALGIAYGVLMETKGYGVQWSVLASICAFAGSIQYLAITLLTTAFDPIQAFLLSIMVNARHLFYGISMLEKYKGLGKLRPFLIFMLTDETYSISSSISPPEGISRKYFYATISFMDYSYWILGTFLGGVLGSFITFNTAGMDFVLTGLFVVLFIEQMTGRKKALSGMIGLVCTAVVLVLFGADNVVIISMVLILLVLLLGRNKLCT
ncbi:MAG: AzlC family ABC transporter permease [Bacillota bacterium]